MPPAKFAIAERGSMMPTEILMPALSPTMEEGTLAKWLVKEGQAVKSGDLLAEIETDKATMEFEAVEEGVIGKLLVAEGTAGVKVNTPIALMAGEGEAIAAAKAAVVAPAAVAQTEVAPVAVVAAPVAVAAKGGKRVFSSPLARRLAADKGIDLAAITGSGPHGRVVKADVDGSRAVAFVAVAAAPAPAPAPARPALATSASAEQVARIYEGRDYEVVTLDGMRKTIAARLTEAKQTIPHFYLRRDVQLDALLAFREVLNKQLAGRGVKLSVNDFLIKACALALQAAPAANAVWAGDRIFRMKSSDVAVAVAIEGGLFTPVLRDAEIKSLSVLSAEMKDLAARAKLRKLAPQEYQGGSFAISNLGMFGIDNFDAVINPPHGSILAVGAGVKRPVVGADGAIKVATVMSMTLSVDHRVIDGALGAEFLKAIIENLENPIGMLV